MPFTERAIGRIERVVWVRLPEVGLAAVVAIHQPRLGVALGGFTLLPGGDSADAVVTAMRQAESATLTARMCGAEVGGGAVVVLGEPSPDALGALGGVIDRLGGSLWLVPDLGCDALEGRVVGRATRFVADPDPADAAAGVLRAVRSGWLQATDRVSVNGARMRVLPGGALAEAVATLASAEGAVVTVDSGLPAGTRSDIVVSCSPAALSEEDVAMATCRVMVGAAGDPLESEAVWQALSARGVVAVPGGIAAGGLVRAAAAVAHAGLARHALSA